MSKSSQNTVFLVSIGNIGAEHAVVLSTRAKAIEWVRGYIEPIQLQQWKHSFADWMKNEGIEDVEAAVRRWLDEEDISVLLVEKSLDPAPGEDPHVSLEYLEEAPAKKDMSPSI